MFASHQLASLFAVFVVLCNQSLGQDWFRWRGPNLDGIAQSEKWSGELPKSDSKIRWRASVGIGFSSFVCHDGLVITMGHQGDDSVVTALDQESGKTTWQFKFPAPLDDRDFEGGPTSTPTIDGDNVYVFSRMGELFCLTLKSGEQIWKTSLADRAQVRLPGWGCSAAPLVLGDKLILNLGEAGMAVNKQTGELIWQSDDRECGYASPVPIPNSDPAAVIIASGKTYVGVEVETGKELWAVRWLTSFNCNAADPIVNNNQMFLSSGYNRGAGLFDLSSEKPDAIWKNKEMKNQIHGSILYQGKLYGIDGDMESGGSLKCLDWATGEVEWSTDDLRPSGLSMVNNQLLVLTEEGVLITAPATPDGWQPISEMNVLEGKCWTSPVFSNDQIYCRTIHGEVVCVDCRE
ncbi:PQQ-binding-like beta-propeller repeat protein [Rhodopirellula sp. MGV]|uniref:PQQ-binding-like beta-propeller repeat protein n=1 Tax=Rhodopirellula sp. MGV TaxID=2023130 RepID=UPI00130434D6|nr:PQQ-binding-like beta-propeller repeat protein [Rhodopirellula sp. MGV]